MVGSIVPSPNLPPAPSQFEPNADNIKRKLLRQGVHPTPKIIRTLTKREILKHNRKAKQQSQSETPSLTASDLQSLAEQSHFLTLKREYKRFSKALNPKTERRGPSLVGKPWERIEGAKLQDLVSEEFNGVSLKRENLKELREMFEEDLRWVLDDDVEVEDDGWLLPTDKQEQDLDPSKRWRNEKEAIRFLVDRLSEREITERHWKFVRIMKQSGLQFTEWQLLRIVEGLGKNGNWRQAMAVVQWLYGNKERKDFKSRFVYTKLLSVLGKARRPQEALWIFKLMLGDCLIYPDLAAYHSIAVTLGQAGLLKELLNIIERMRQKPSKRIKNMRSKKWDPVLEPDLVVYNAVLNACVPLHQWKGVSWVFEQLRKSGLRPNEATYGLAMEVMLQSGKYDLVHEYYRKMKRSGEAPRALTYKVLVKAFWEEGKINEAVETVRGMEQRGVIGTASVYYELACCLCKNGRWQDAMIEVDKIKKLSTRKPLEITFTGLIMASLDGGYVDDCISIFEYMKDHCAPNIGTINAMLRVYGQNDMFSKAKELFEKTNKARSGPYGSLNGKYGNLTPDGFTYSLLLEASASAHQWEYFEYVYKEMALCGYQLDQSKHPILLVEASRAGKWHLLEHAFEASLEGGEIPHPLIFTEMLIQATLKSNYEKAVTLVNTMAQAPFQVSEKQWTEHFVKNGDRVTQGCLVKLLDALSSSELSSEVTALNLLRSLQSLCGNGDTCDSESLNIPSIFGNMMVEKGKAATGLSEATDTGKNEEDGVNADSMNYLLNYDIDDSTRDYANGVTSNEPSSCSGKQAPLLNLDEYTKDVDESEADLPVNDGDSHTSKLPSAQEILESWKKSREKDGIYFPFHLGQK
ncbi:embryo defective 1408, DELAYED GREENING 1, EMBRYO DEFECTIVE 246, thermo sensitive leaf color 1 [Hibiscus trionum]|uniref:Embryo defective 1408, DELAYED GREENING 1, EMBRYO DEFECTIVE 246, thermo sensitive leaf color 1 n=1 Tax=Hibiscus trionum TaxID=183268 RepID=A0A9W7MGX8_HIBTR|nr:embryo defective 1408, DELAYED GREENING 1, EMBRYO DEFECTIVE 246, thermo sensitive leaf color 1 [Hibiscus trionum]